MFVKTLFCILRNPRVELAFKRTLSSVAETGSIQTTQPVMGLAECNFDTRLLKVAIIGTPNAGKSTVINNLTDRRVCATSSKVHTTRNKAMAVFTVNDAQIVFMDTPGLVNDKEKKKFHLERAFIKDSKSVLREADVVGVIHDVSNVWTRERLDIKIINLLDANNDIPSILLLNKIDVLRSKRKLLDITRQLTENCLDGKPIPGSRDFKKRDETSKGWQHFSEIFMVSALTGNGLSEVKNYLLKQAKPGKWMFPEHVWTDQSPEQVVTRAAHAILLDYLPQEMPYLMKPELEYFNIDSNGVVTAAIAVSCPSERIAKLAAGTSDGRLKQITESLQEDLQDTFQNHVRLKIVLKPPKTSK